MPKVSLYELEHMSDEATFEKVRSKKKNKPQKEHSEKKNHREKKLAI